MVDFRKMLSPKTRRQSREGLDRILAFQEMDRRDMAAALLEARRSLVDSGLFELENPESYMDWRNDDWALYRNIPALAICLDPDITLRPDEMSGPDDEWDPLIKVRSGDHGELLGSLELIMAHKLFDSARTGVEEVRMAANFLHDGRGRWSAMEVAVDTVSPGTFPGRIRAAAEAPLIGYQLIASHGDHDRVERFAENREDLEELFRVTSAKRLQEEISDSEEQVLRQLRSWPERLDFDALSLQSCDGEILKEMQVPAHEPERDIEPEL